MKFTEEDREELKRLIAEVLGEVEQGRKVIEENNAEYEMERVFDNWMINDIHLADIAIAPTDFVLPCDFRLKDGTVLKRGKRFFTYDEAMALEEQLFKPNGWRLPSKAEFVMLYGAYGIDDDGGDDANNLMSEMKLEANGWISSEDMDDYNEDPENCDGTINDRTTYGYWWSRTSSSSTGAYYLYAYIDSSKGGVNAQDSSFRGFGLSVRCVAL